MHAHDAHSTSRRAYDAVTILHILEGPMHTSRTCRPAPRSPLRSHHAHARADTRRDKPHPPRRHVRVMARVTQNSAHQQAAHRTSHTHAAYKHASPARLDDVPRSRSHCALRTAHTSLHARRRTHATHSMAHNSAHPTHRPQKITPSHTRGLGARLTAELSCCPASTGCCRRVGC